MIVKFKPNQNISSGFAGIINAIKTAATAAAGDSPTIPYGCSDWQILSNVEAGGWSQTKIDSDLAAGGPLTTGSHKLELVSNKVSKNPNLKEKLMFGLYVGNTNMTYWNWWCPYMGTLNTETGTILRQKYIPHPSASAGTYYRGMQTTAGAAQHYMIVAVTEDYLVFWNSNSTTDVDYVQHDSRLIAGCHPISSSSADSDEIVMKNYMLFSTYNNDSTIRDSTRMEGLVYASTIGQGITAARGSIDGVLWNGSNNVSTIPLNNATSTLRGPAYYYHNDSFAFEKTWDSDGNKVLSLNPIGFLDTYYDSAAGYKQMRGLSVVGWRDRSISASTDWANAYSNYGGKKVKADDGMDYLMLNVGACVFAVPFEGSYATDASYVLGGGGSDLGARNYTNIGFPKMSVGPVNPGVVATSFVQTYDRISDSDNFTLTIDSARLQSAAVSLTSSAGGDGTPAQLWFG